MKSNNVIILALILLCGTACHQGTSRAKELQDIQQRLSLIDLKIKEIREKQLAMDDRITSLDKMQTDRLYNNIVLHKTLDHLENNNEPLKVDSKDFLCFLTNLGPVLVSVEGIWPYLDGYQLRLSMGNINNVTYKGLHVFANWNSINQFTDHQEFSKKTKEFDFVNTLYPGCWNSVDLFLPSLTMEEIRNIKIIISFKTVSLRDLNRN